MQDAGQVEFLCFLGSDRDTERTLRPELECNKHHFSRFCFLSWISSARIRKPSESKSPDSVAMSTDDGSQGIAAQSDPLTPYTSSGLCTAVIHILDDGMQMHDAVPMRIFHSIVWTFFKLGLLRELRQLPRIQAPAKGSPNQTLLGVLLNDRHQREDWFVAASSKNCFDEIWFVYSL